MATLAEAVDAGETDWTISADTAADFLTVESETVAVLTHFPVQLDPQTRLPLPPRIRVQRGAGGTTAASHADGTTLTPLIPPASSGGVGGAIAVDNTVDPPTEVTTIIAAGAQIDGATATLGIIVSVEEPTLPDAQFWLRKIADANSYQLYVRDAVGESWLLASAGVGSGDYGDGFEDGQTRQVGWFDIENGTLIGLTAGSDRLVLLRTTSADGSTTSELEMSSTQIKFTPAAGEFVVEDLPTADPVVANALWIDTAAGRVLKVSAG